MAEIIATELLKAVFEKLASEAFKTYVRSQGIHSELKKLERTLTQIQSLLNDASQKEINDEAVKLWLNDLQHLAYDIDDLLDDLATEAVHREYAQQSGAITSQVRRLVPTSLINTPGIVGREKEKKELLMKLFEDASCDQNFSIVPIVGMGGLGKTTLARLLYDDEEVVKHFELKAWVCVSDQFDIFNTSQAILQAVKEKNKEFPDLNLLQIALRNKLKGKRFLIVLDDVWSESYGDWETLALLHK